MSLEKVIKAARAFLEPNQVQTVIYHSPCADGSGAAFSAWLALGDKASYEPFCRQNEQPFDLTLLKGKNIILIDCAFKKKDLPQARSLANKLIILDHHRSAMQDLEGEPGCFFTMGNCGAILAWHYFYGLESSPPQLLRLIEDRDILQWQKKELSEPLAYGLSKINPNYNFRQYKEYTDESKLFDLIRLGKQIQLETQKLIVASASKAQMRLLHFNQTKQSYKVMCLEMPSYDLTVEVSEYLYKNITDLDFTMLWHPLDNNRFRISFRTDRPNIDLSIIASRFGGGGHANKAGATVDHSPWELLELD